MFVKTFLKNQPGMMITSLLHQALAYRTVCISRAVSLSSVAAEANSQTASGHDNKRIK